MRRRVDGSKQNTAHTPSRGAPATISATSACVGFCPNARRRSPSTSRGTAPVPFLSNSANASLYSAPPSVNPRTDIRYAAAMAHLRYRSATSGLASHISLPKNTARTMMLADKRTEDREEVGVVWRKGCSTSTQVPPGYRRRLYPEP